MDEMEISRRNAYFEVPLDVFRDVSHLILSQGRGHERTLDLSGLPADVKQKWREALVCFMAENDPDEGKERIYRKPDIYPIAVANNGYGAPGRGGLPSTAADIVTAAALEDPPLITRHKEGAASFYQLTNAGRALYFDELRDKTERLAHPSRKQPVDQSANSQSTDRGDSTAPDASEIIFNDLQIERIRTAMGNLFPRSQHHLIERALEELQKPSSKTPGS